ncbi:uncharacterized protein K444DRAFT_625282 [Hyaloscypha bicolor E]|uniref:Uncharacterized protein n=1 Tax=Hyaloscypha bicolor E TaxID=1095630 RepID=A0A2J6TNL0_9HELO|nr:uncharacterized protein K444DRAFT_625282 [Hyaloscypha bicolor E]PMD64611.1 hypothetical protein K444DRAFT_625282 [Hyaloscypha bicolor E]
MPLLNTNTNTYTHIHTQYLIPNTHIIPTPQEFQGTPSLKLLDDGDPSQEASCIAPKSHRGSRLCCCTGIYRASTSFYPDTPPASDAGPGSPLADSTKEERTPQPVKRIQTQEKLEKFIANTGAALIQLVNNHWERLAAGLKVQELHGDPFSSDKRLRRVYHYHELRRLRVETELHWLRRALSLIRNLRDFQEYLEENGYRPSDTSNHRLRHAYLYYQVKDPLNKLELMAKIEAVGSASGQELTIRIPYAPTTHNGPRKLAPGTIGLPGNSDPMTPRCPGILTGLRSRQS